MKSVLENDFPELFAALRDERSPLVYVGRFREWGLRLLNGPAGGPGEAFDAIAFCPFTGRRLPPSLRHEWFDRLDSLGLEPSTAAVPASYQTEAWWADRAEA